PFRPTAILMQHHALARLPRPLAPVGSAPLCPLHQPRRMQLRLNPRVTPGEPRGPLQVLVKVLDVPAPVLAAILIEHPGDLVYRHPPRRSLVTALGSEGSKVLLLVTVP